MRTGEAKGLKKVGLGLGLLLVLGIHMWPASATVARQTTADTLPAVAPVGLEVTGFDESATWFDGIELDGPDWGERLAD